MPPWRVSKAEKVSVAVRVVVGHRGGQGPGAGDVLAGERCRCCCRRPRRSTPAKPPVPVVACRCSRGAARQGPLAPPCRAQGVAAVRPVTCQRRAARPMVIAAVASPPTEPVRTPAERSKTSAPAPPLRVCRRAGRDVEVVDGRAALEGLEGGEAQRVPVARCRSCEAPRAQVLAVLARSGCRRRCRRLRPCVGPGESAGCRWPCRCR